MTVWIEWLDNDFSVNQNLPYVLKFDTMDILMYIWLYSEEIMYIH